jgi:hypothetical protein
LSPSCGLDQICLNYNLCDNTSHVFISSPTIESLGRKEALHYQENYIREPNFFVDYLESVVFWRKYLLNIANEGEGSDLKKSVTFEFIIQESDGMIQMKNIPPSILPKFGGLASEYQDTFLFNF